MELTGFVIPTPTPFQQDGSIDQGAYREYLRWIADLGTRSILIAGTTGEFFSLTAPERRRLLAIAREAFPGHIIYHAGRGSLLETLEDVRAGHDGGADLIMSLPPFYYAGCPAAGVARFLTAIAEACSLPFMIYNFPKHTQNPATAEVLRSVPHYGIKDSSSNLELIPETPRYFIGGPNVLEAMERGGKGWISAAGAANPRCHVALERALGAADTGAQHAAKAEMDALVAHCSGPWAIPRIKAKIAKELPGFPARLRLPLLPEE